MDFPIEIKDNMEPGVECRKCGFNIRYKKSRKCVYCKRLASKAWYHEKCKDADWVAAENERKARYRRANPEKCREAIRQWSLRNKDRINEKARQRRRTNPQKYRDKQNKWRASVPDKVRAYNLQAQYGITLDDYLRMHEEQDGLCAICKCPEMHRTTLSVDHCHRTGEVRGLLCNLCNTGLGRFEDNPELVAEALSYLLESENNAD